MNGTSFWRPGGDYLDYLAATATPGGTMSRYGMEATLGNLSPSFATRLLNAVTQAQAEGINASIHSAYRAPSWGVGGYRDKFNSLHAYGLAVDVAGIGRPGSVTAERWYEIASANGIFNPYGPDHPKEWNHYQAVPQKGREFIVDNPDLRATIDAGGPIDREQMWAAAETAAANYPIPPANIPNPPQSPFGPSLTGSIDIAPRSAFPEGFPQPQPRPPYAPPMSFASGMGVPPVPGPPAQAPGIPLPPMRPQMAGPAMPFDMARFAPGNSMSPPVDELRVATNVPLPPPRPDRAAGVPLPPMRPERGAGVPLPPMRPTQQDPLVQAAMAGAMRPMGVPPAMSGIGAPLPPMPFASGMGVPPPMPTFAPPFGTDMSGMAFTAGGIHSNPELPGSAARRFDNAVGPQPIDVSTGNSPLASGIESYDPASPTRTPTPAFDFGRLPTVEDLARAQAGNPTMTVSPEMPANKPEGILTAPQIMGAADAIDSTFGPAMPFAPPSMEASWPRSVPPVRAATGNQMRAATTDLTRGLFGNPPATDLTTANSPLASGIESYDPAKPAPISPAGVAPIAPIPGTVGGTAYDVNAPGGMGLASPAAPPAAPSPAPPPMPVMPGPMPPPASYRAPARVSPPPSRSSPQMRPQAPAMSPVNQFIQSLLKGGSGMPFGFGLNGGMGIIPGSSITPSSPFFSAGGRISPTSGFPATPAQIAADLSNPFGGSSYVPAHLG